MHRQDVHRPAPGGRAGGGTVSRQETPAQVERRRARDRVNKALARARAKGLEIPADVPRGTPARRVFLPVSRAPKSDWQDQAACKSEPPEWFDADTDEDAARALRVCARCPVRRDCLRRRCRRTGPPTGCGAGSTCPLPTGARPGRRRHEAAGPDAGRELPELHQALIAHLAAARSRSPSRSSTYRTRCPGWSLSHELAGRDPFGFFWASRVTGPCPSCGNRTSAGVRPARPRRGRREPSKCAGCAS